MRKLPTIPKNKNKPPHRKVRGLCLLTGNRIRRIQLQADVDAGVLTVGVHHTVDGSLQVGLVILVGQLLGGVGRDIAVLDHEDLGAGSQVVALTVNAQGAVLVGNNTVGVGINGELVGIGSVGNRIHGVNHDVAVLVVLDLSVQLASQGVSSPLTMAS